MDGFTKKELGERSFIIIIEDKLDQCSSIMGREGGVYGLSNSS